MAGQVVQQRLTDPVLTSLALGYRNEEFVGTNILPIVEIPKEGARLPKFGKEAFVVESDERELHAASNKITPAKVTTDNIALTEKDLAYPIDYRENKEADFAYEQYAVSIVSEKMALNREKRIATLVTNEASYAASNKVTLSGSSQFSAKGSDIFGVFDDGFEAVRKAGAGAVNTIIIPANAWVALRSHAQIVDVLKRRGLQRLTPALLAELLADDGQKLNISIGRASYRATLDGVDTPIWANDIVMAHVAQPDANGKHFMYNPSFGYTFRREGALVVDKYDEVGGKVYNVRTTDINKEYMLMAEAGYLIKSAV
ncbi:hypothetical protein L4F91_06790 [Avibacterium sp. 20-126]|uniref:hypothetical protein n=1 Tax=Avibacterium sp. 20-126 TaxID=2911524 RepID=UPI0021845F5B|nr:hypothetical protein L4F91_06790 [Avibacterium sp. 20-126]